MNLSSKSDGSGKSLMKRICIAVIIVIVFSLATKKIVLHNKEVAIKDQFQEDMCIKLNTIQREIGIIIKNGNRLEVRSLALSYMELGTMHYDIGGWDTIAYILVGMNSNFPLFEAYDGALTVEEISFLDQLSDMNKELLSYIADAHTPRGIKDMSINSFYDILNSYNSDPLRALTMPTNLE